MAKKVSERRFYLPNTSCHIAIFGETGSGKSGTMKVIGEIRRDYNWKILDLYDGASEENCYWCLPSNYRFWGTDGKRGRTPQGYDTRILVPVIFSKLPKELPNICKLFKIRIIDLTSDDIKALIGKQISSSVSALWGVVSKHIKESTKPYEFLEIIKRSAKGDKDEIGAGKVGLKILYNIIEPMVREGLICSSDDEQALDLLTELKDRHIITSLMLKYVPVQLGHLNLRSFIVQHLLRKMFELKQQSEGNLRKLKVSVLMREATDFLSKGGMGDMGESDMAVRDIISKVLKQGRKFNLFVIIDAQSPSLLNQAVKGQFKIVLAHQIGDYSDLDEIVSPSVKDQVTTELKWSIGELPNRYCAVLKPREKRQDGVIVGEGAFITEMLPPRTRLMEEGEDFIQIFREERPEDMIKISDMINKNKEEQESEKKEIIEENEMEVKKKEYQKKIKKLQETNPDEYIKQKEKQKKDLLEHIKNI